VARDRGAGTPLACVQEPFSRVPFAYALSAAYAHMVRWFDTGVQPPVSGQQGEHTSRHQCAQCSTAHHLPVRVVAQLDAGPADRADQWPDDEQRGPEDQHQDHSGIRRNGRVYGGPPAEADDQATA
jgi:hypothetical protein